MNCHLNYIKLFYYFPTILIDNKKVKKPYGGSKYLHNNAVIIIIRTTFADKFEKQNGLPPN